MSNFNSIESLLSPQNQFHQQAQPILDQLQTGASNAAKHGVQMLKGTGSDFKHSLGLLGLLSSRHGLNKIEQARHVTKAHHVTETDVQTKTEAIIETAWSTETEKVKVTQTREVAETKTERFTVTEYATKTTTKHATVTDHTAKVHTKQKTATTWQTKTKIEKNKSPKITAVVPPIGSLPIGRSWMTFPDPRSGERMHCRNDGRHFKYFGKMKNLIDYDSVKDNKFKKCVKNGGDVAKCFDKDMPPYTPVEYVPDRADKNRGVVCASGPRNVECWSTPNLSTVDYKKLKGNKLAECLSSPDKC